MIESTTNDGVAVLAMRHGKANALDTELCQALCGALDDAAADGAAGRRPAAGCPGPGVRPHQALATAAVPRPRSRSGRPRRRGRCDLAGPAHPGTHPVLHDLAQISRDRSKASPGMADKQIGEPAFRSRSTTTAGPRPSREIRLIALERSLRSDPLEVSRSVSSVGLLNLLANARL